MRIHTLIITFGLFGLTACATGLSPTPTPDYTIRVLSSQSGTVAVPPNCPSWVTEQSNPYDQQPLPQFGCASARNLALMAETPDDLVKGREMGPVSGTKVMGAMRRYNNDQTRGLVWTGSDSNQIATTTSSIAASPISGETPIASPSTSSSK